MAVVMGIGIGSFSNEMATVQGDADMNIVYWQLKLAREIAINQRRAVEVVFTPPNFISLVRHDFPNGTTVVLFTGKAFGCYYFRNVIEAPAPRR